MALNDDRFPEILLQLPASLQEQAAEMAFHEQVSLNLFVATAIAEKLQRMLLQECLDISEAEEFPYAQPAKNLPHVH